MFTKHTLCRACGNSDLIDVFNLGVVPLANSFKGEGEEQDGYVPLTVAFCPTCSLAQLRQTVSYQILYAKNYAYETSKSETMRLHFRSLWDAIREQSKAESVIEVGSNDGDFILFARENGADAACGIDPAANLTAKAYQRGIQTITGILDDKTAAMASQAVPKADVIVARHVFCHVDDWRGFMRNLDAMANRDTLVVIEAPYVVDTLERGEFDQIYHEHTSYLSLKALVALLENTSFRLQKVMRFPIHGGSIAVFIRRRDSDVEPDASVSEFLTKENITVETWAVFRDAAFNRIYGLERAIMASDGVVCGFGASAKSTVWISACEFTKRQIAFIVDNTPAKQGKFSPGTDIPIVPESELEKADVAICFAWNFFSEIQAKHKTWTDKGCRFINPHAL